MKDNWKVENIGKNKDRVFEDLEPVIEAVLIRRGIIDHKEKEAFLHPDYDNNLIDPFYFDGMKEAVTRVLKAREKKEKVCIYGDYDADGVTSSVLLKDVFDQLGIENFCYIPERNKEGYGINEEAINYVKNKGASLLITVDCGISNYQEVEYAKTKDLDIIILDHHHVPPKLPKALAIVNPKLNQDINNSNDLAGVGVAFKFAQGLTSKVANFDEDRLKWLLDLVCLGTIADCVSLLGENRTLSKFGLIVLARTKRVGLRQLFNVGRINIDENNLPNSHQVAFQLAPRINAAGRMDHANTAFELLSLSEDKEAQARILALELESQNQRRQKVTKLIVEEVENKIDNLGNMPVVIIERSPIWEMGVVGLAAGRIAEKYYRPTILLRSEDGKNRGSGRSIEEFNLIANLEKQAGLLEKYGGHSQAAGLVIADENLEKFSLALRNEGKRSFDDGAQKSLVVDSELPFSDINEKLLKELEMLEPFGYGNREPVFLSRKVTVVDKKLIGKEGKHLKLWLKDNQSQNKLYEAIGFGMGGQYLQIAPKKEVDVVFNLEKNNWNGKENIQLKLIDFSQ